jgi:heptosyltransferase III
VVGIPLVARGGALGDFVLTLPLLAAIRDRHGRRSTLCAAPGHGALAVDAGLARATLRLDDPRLVALWSGGDLTAARALLGPVGPAYVLRPVDADTVGRRLRTLGADPIHILDPRPPADGSKHAADHLLAALGSPAVVPTAGGLTMPDELCARAASAHRRLAVGGGEWVVLAPGAGGELKRWRLESFRELAVKLEAAGVAVAWLLGPVERERWVGFQPVRCLPDAGPSMTAALLTGAALLVGNDTGTSHLAAALATPVLALFGPTDHRTWAPRGPAVRVLRDPEYGPSCDLCPRPCDRVHPAACLDALSVDRVVEAALAAMGSSGENASDPP